MSKGLFSEVWNYEGRRADLLPCKCFDDYYRKLVNQTSYIFSAEELRLLWQWASLRFDSPRLHWAYDNARDAYFENGKAYHGRGGDEIKFWTHYPVDEDKVKIIELVHDIAEASDDPLYEAERRDKLARFMQGEINWQEIGVINRILKKF